MEFNEIKEQLLDYLEKYQAAVNDEMEKHASLTEKEREEAGFSVYNAEIVGIDNGICQVCTPVNNTKWRCGDKVECKSASGEKLGSATVINNFSDQIQIECVSCKIGDIIEINELESDFVNIIIESLNRIENGSAGGHFLSWLFDPATIKKEGFLPLGEPDLTGLNEKQKQAVCNIVKRPNIYTIQGPPGTGKTNVLSSIAKAFSERGKNVLVLCNSHEAVNNALNQIATANIPAFKIGPEFKNQSLKSTITKFKSINGYNQKRHGRIRRSNHEYGDVIGMTLYGAIISLQFHNTAFVPSIVLVDEASQIPMPIASTIGAFGASTYVFIGDNRQMPPIFPQEIKQNPLSISIFEHFHASLPDELRTVLDTTYRMNRKICDFVSKSFYEPCNIQLKCFEEIANRCVDGENIDNSIEIIPVESNLHKDFNDDEAVKCVEFAEKYTNMGLKVAIISPYRKQVNCVRKKWLNSGRHDKNILIDTVERLQGQDVDVIIITTSCSDPDYYQTQKDFILDPNRLNVMVSRAKIKAIIIKNKIVEISI